MSTTRPKKMALRIAMRIAKKAKIFGNSAVMGGKSGPVVFAAVFGVLAISVSPAQAFDFSAIGVASSSNYTVNPTPDVLTGGGDWIWSWGNSWF